jgi:hypothetical protein
MAGSGQAAADDTSPACRTATSGHSHCSLSAWPAAADSAVRAADRCTCGGTKVWSRTFCGWSTTGRWSALAAVRFGHAGTGLLTAESSLAGGAFAAVPPGEVVRHATGI